MSAFTDEELERFKAAEMFTPSHKFYLQMKALLARLEVAEQVLIYASCLCPKEKHHDSCNFTELWTAWRKSKGDSSPGGNAR